MGAERTRQMTTDVDMNERRWYLDQDDGKEDGPK